MAISADARFEFDVQGYIHLRGALSPAELAEYDRWSARAEGADIATLNADDPNRLRYHINRPISRVIDADPKFARFLDHPAVEPYLTEFLGADYKHIDNELYYTHPAYEGGGWHRGVDEHGAGHVVGGAFICPMVKAFYCLSDVGPGGGEFVVVPGSHRSRLPVETKGRIDLPGQHVFDDVSAGDIILFNEALLHNGRPNTTDRTRKTIIVNFGRVDAGVWPGYAPARATLDGVTSRQRDILSNTTGVWSQPDLSEVM
jgi:hypothetical protein